MHKFIESRMGKAFEPNRRVHSGEPMVEGDQFRVVPAWRDQMNELPHLFEAEQEEKLRIPVPPEMLVSGHPSRHKFFGAKPGFCGATAQRKDERGHKSLYGQQRGGKREVRVKCGDTPRRGDP